MEKVPKENFIRLVKMNELIHSNPCGLLLEPSLVGSRYFVLFTYDYNEKSWVFFFKTKNDTFETFKVFKNIVEKENKIKILKIICVGEFLSRKFNKFCEQNEIVKQLTTIETPHYNDVSKHKSKTILERARCMAIKENIYQNTFELKLKLTQLQISQTKIPHFQTMGCHQNMVIMARYQISTT